MYPYKIFQIGFNKCATTSIFHLFNKYTDLKAVHWDGGNLALHLENNIKNNKDNILGQYSKYNVFTDMECVRKDRCVLLYREHFKNLYSAFPDSKFILNIRDVNRWIISLKKIQRGQYIKYYMIHKNLRSNNLDLHLQKVWHKHVNDVMDFFKDKDNLLIYNIDTDDFHSFKLFFNDINFRCNTLPLSNVTKIR